MTGIPVEPFQTKEDDGFSISDWLSRERGTETKADTAARIGPKDPDRSQRVLRVQKQTALDHGIIDRNLENLETRIWRNDMAPAVAAYAPAIRNWLSENPHHIAAASRDLPALNDFARYVKTFQDTLVAITGGIPPHITISADANDTGGGEYNPRTDEMFLSPSGKGRDPRLDPARQVMAHEFGHRYDEGPGAPKGGRLAPFVPKNAPAGSEPHQYEATMFQNAVSFLQDPISRSSSAEKELASVDRIQPGVRQVVQQLLQQPIYSQHPLNNKGPFSNDWMLRGSAPPPPRDQSAGGFLSRYVRNVSDQLVASVDQFRLQQLAKKDWNDTLTPREQEEYDYLATKEQPKQEDYSLITGALRGIPGLGSIADFAVGIGPAVANQATVLAQTLGGSAKGAAFGAAVGGVGAGLAFGPEAVGEGAVKGARLGALIFAGDEARKMEMYSSYVQFRQMKDAEGKPISKDIAKTAAFLYGAAAGGVEMLELHQISKYIPGVKSLARDRVATALASPTFRRWLTGAAADLAKTGAWEGGTEGVQQLMQNTAGIIAQMVADKSITTLSTEEILTRLGEGVVESMKMGAQAGIGTAGAGHVIAAPSAIREIRAANQSRKLFEALGDLSKNSELAKKLPHKLEEVVDRITKDGPIENIYVPITKWNELFQSQDVDPAAIAREVTGSDQAYIEGNQSGDIAIPTSKYAAHIAPTELHAKLIDDLRLGSPLAMNANETRAMIDEFANKETGVTPPRIVYRGAPTNELGKGDFPGTFTAQDPKTAEQYAQDGAVHAFEVVGQQNILDSADPKLRELAQEFEAQRGEGAFNPNVDPTDTTSDLTEGLLFPTPEWVAFLKEKGYTGTSIGKEEFFFDPASLRPADTRVAIDKAVATLAPAWTEKLTAATKHIRGVTDEYVQTQVQTLERVFRNLASRPDVDVNKLTQIFNALKIGNEPAPAAAPRTLNQSVTLRTGTQTLELYGLDPTKEWKAREVANALEQWAREQFGIIERGDFSPEALEKIAQWITLEVMFENQSPSTSGKDWYGKKFQRAMDKMAVRFPELKRGTKGAKQARNLFTLFTAITSNGVEASENLAKAAEIFEVWRTTGKFELGSGSGRGEQIRTNLKVVADLYAKHGPDGIHKYLLHTMPISLLTKMAKGLGAKFSVGYQAHIPMPRAAVLLGPKLGAFYANLMGQEEYLTMDRWWSRTFNRYRGTLTSAPTKQGLARFRELIGQPDLNDEQTIEATVEYRRSLEARSPASQLEDLIGERMPEDLNKEQKDAWKEMARQEVGNDTEFKKLWKQHQGRAGFRTELAVLMGSSEPTNKVAKEKWLEEAKAKAGDRFDALYKQHTLERAANTIYKMAYENINDTPFGAKDRTFMLDAVARAQQILAEKGHPHTKADIQAILWYYEKKLYGTLTNKKGRGTIGIAFDDAADITLSGGNKSKRSAASGVRADAANGPRVREDIRGYGSEDDAAVFGDVAEAEASGDVIFNPANAQYSAPETVSEDEAADNNVEEATIAYGSVDEALAASDRLSEMSKKKAQKWKRFDFLPAIIPDVADRLKAIASVRGRKFVDVRGQVINNPKDAYEVLAPFRDPRIEKSHVLILDDHGVVLSHEMLTSGAIDYVQFANDFSETIIKRAARLGAKNVVLSHNHPSGNPMPSPDDMNFTGFVGFKLQDAGIRLVGHAVLDHNKLSWIGPGAGGLGYEFHDVPAKNPRAKNPKTVAEDLNWGNVGTSIHGPQDVKDIIVANTGRGALQIMYLDSQLGVIALEGRAKVPNLAVWLPARVREVGAARVIIAGSREVVSPLRNAQNLTPDLIDIMELGDRPGSIMSYVEQGVYTPAMRTTDTVEAHRLREGAWPDDVSQRRSTLVYPVVTQENATQYWPYWNYGLAPGVETAPDPSTYLHTWEPGTDWFHGGTNADLTLDKPTFWTSVKSGAEWYVEEKGGSIHNARLDGLSLANDADLRAIINELGITQREFAKVHSVATQGADFSQLITELDVLYHPALRQALRDHGFDGYVGFDPLMNDDLPVIVTIGNTPNLNRIAGRSYDQPAYHGSPHRFDAFSLHAIGTGEGAQAYGWGLYFAGHKAVAAWYRDQLSGPRPVTHWSIGGYDLVKDGKYLKGVDGESEMMMELRSALLSEEYRVMEEIDQVGTGFGGGVNAVAAILGSVIDGVRNFYEGTPAEEEFLKKLEVEARKGNFKFERGQGEGHIYTVDIPSDDTLLHWNKSFENQPKPVRDALASAGFDPEGITVTGQQIYEDWAVTGSMNEFMNAQQAGGSIPTAGFEEQASRYLASLGINGIKYPADIIHKRGYSGYNYVIFDDKLIKIMDMEQAQQGGAAPEPHGRIRFSSTGEGINIDLLKTANLSTFVHETGHFYMEVLTQLAETSPSVKRDLEILRAWVGAKEGEQLNIDQHEKIARGFEAYMMEGNAPTPALQGAFSRMKAWMILTYRSVTEFLKAYNITLTDEVRGVFDRLVASEDEIAQAQAGLTPLFSDPESLGMTEGKAAEYRKAIDTARQAARDELEQKALADVKREHTQAWKAAREQVRADVAEQMNEDPVWRALSVLQRHKMPDGTDLPEGFPVVKLDREATLKLLGGDKDVLQSLPPGTYVKDGGIHPDQAAEILGFESGAALLKALPGRGTETALARVERLTDERMKAEYGDLLNDGVMAEQAAQAVHNVERSRLLRLELEHLASNQIGALKGLVRKITRRIPSNDAVRSEAERFIARKTNRSIRPHEYLAGEKRAAKMAQEALLRGDIDGAFREKLTELVNHERYRAASKARETNDKTIKYLAKFQTDKVRARFGKVGGPFLDQIDQLLERFEFRPISQNLATKRQSLLKFSAEHPDVDIPEHLLESAAQKNYLEMTHEELNDLRDTVIQLAHQVKLKDKLLKLKAARDREDAAMSVAGEIEANAKRTLPTDIETRLPANERGRGKTEWFSGHRKYSSLLREMAGFVEDSKIWQLLIRPLNEAATDEASRNEKATIALDGLFGEYSAEEMRDMYEKQPINGTSITLSKMGRLMVALNWGNEVNRQRLISGYSRKGYTEKTFQSIIDSLDERDWRFVQGVWDYINTFWPELESLGKDLKGLPPVKVESSPFQTRFGEIKGGYFPIAYDDRQSNMAYEKAAKRMADRIQRGAAVRATTERGMLEERVEGDVQGELRLDFNVIFGHVAEVIHTLTHTAVLRDVSSVLSHEAVADAVKAHYGDIVYRQLTKTLDAIAEGDVASQNGLEKAISWLRQGSTIVGLGYSFTTMALQPFGVSNAVPRIGAKWVGVGIKQWIRNPVKAVEVTHAKSEFMRLRHKTFMREINEIQNTIGSSGKVGRWADEMLEKLSGDRVTRHDILDSFFWGIGKMQMVADVPTWIGAYEKALDSNHDEDTAVAMADQAVKDSQGHGQTMDLAEFQRGGPMFKLFTNFYSYFNVVYQQLAEAKAKTDFKSVSSVGRLAVDFMLVVTVPSALGLMLRSAVGGDDDKKSFLEKIVRDQISSLLGTMILTRELSGFAQGYFQYSGPAGSRIFGEVGRLMLQAQQGKLDEGLFKSLNKTAGILLHYPAGAVERFVRGVAAMSAGETSNPLSLLFGPPKNSKGK